MLPAIFGQRERLVGVSVCSAEANKNAILIVGGSERTPAVRDNRAVTQDRRAHISFFKRIAHKRLREIEPGRFGASDQRLSVTLLEHASGKAWYDRIRANRQLERLEVNPVNPQPQPSAHTGKKRCLHCRGETPSFAITEFFAVVQIS